MVIGMNVVVDVTSAEMERYRALVADIEGMSDPQKDDAIMIVVNMMQAFVDAAWASIRFNKLNFNLLTGGVSVIRFRLLEMPSPLTSDARAQSQKMKTRDLRHERGSTEESCHLRACIVCAADHANRWTVVAGAALPPLLRAQRL
jgi:hypothetical protein